MYQDLKKDYCWPEMKRYITLYVARCLVCQKVKVEHEISTGILQPIKVKEWKYDSVAMDFVVGLPST